MKMHLKVRKGEIKAEIARLDGCSGWKYPTECLHEGVYDSDSSACKECEEDAYEVMLDDVGLSKIKPKEETDITLFLSKEEK